MSRETCPLRLNQTEHRCDSLSHVRACMLTNCHDIYHGTWGDDHHEAEEMCAAAAEAFSADVLTCRLMQCEAAVGDEALCEGTLAGLPCE
ncbi:hypothetical protein OV203_11005 [Nannocystis sp. ILAH1]|uniref:hypothetical protein n=1 Tax=unclassified Nannocystis TaxID=2627009 RepID=UPI002271ACBB|nr:MULTISPECIES: hypothetical protein [unclassified Nannocystis]MCY0987655.1 hypothetical protein [Nannocystis sp. ILAH1]MCY1070545.1 hypothetical protein [Nannocystis sp. RBIL2]